MPYAAGDEERRPWGHYRVIAVGHNESGEEVCEKHLQIEPRCAVSLQSHCRRRETWIVLSGEVTVLVGTRCWVPKIGERVVVPALTLHSMANLTESPCFVQEIQEGLCFEEDIIRYIDPYARQTVPLPTQEPGSLVSMALYRQILETLGVHFLQDPKK